MDDIGGALNRIKSVYRLMMIDKEREDFSRVAIQFAGLGDLMTKYQERLAAAADIPMTRWAGRSPGGLNASGDSDMNNYVMMVEANRENNLAHVLPVLDLVLARDAGLKDVPEFKWNSLLELSEKDQAEVSKIKVEAVALGVTSSLFDEDEGRAALDGDPIFGDLPGPAPEPDPLLLPPTDPFGGPPKGNDDD